MIDLTKKISELKRQIKVCTKTAQRSKHQHVQERNKAAAHAKKQHVKDLEHLQGAIKKLQRGTLIIDFQEIAGQ